MLKPDRRRIVVDLAAADTRMLILDAARCRLLADGYAGLSTRKVAAINVAYETIARERGL